MIRPGTISNAIRTAFVKYAMATDYELINNNILGLFLGDRMGEELNELIYIYIKKIDIRANNRCQS